MLGRWGAGGISVISTVPISTVQTSCKVTKGWFAVQFPKRELDPGKAKAKRQKQNTAPARSMIPGARFHVQEKPR